jgi:hypothetical protein
LIICLKVRATEGGRPYVLRLRLFGFFRLGRLRLLGRRFSNIITIITPTQTNAAATTSPADANRTMSDIIWAATSLTTLSATPPIPDYSPKLANFSSSSFS